MSQIMKLTQSNFVAMKSSQDISNRNHEAFKKNLETQIGMLSEELAAQSTRGFGWNMLDNPMDESCRDIYLRNKLLSLVINHRNKVTNIENKIEVKREVEYEWEVT